MTIQILVAEPNAEANGSVLKNLKVERPFYQQQQFNNVLDYSTSKDEKKALCSNPLDNLRPFKILQNIFPIFSWMQTYDLKKDLISDIISGSTVGVMHIPQGMGYAMLAMVPPIVGLYTAFFPVLIYFLFGTSRHNSMGTFAVVSIMVGKVVMKYANNPAAVLPGYNSTGFIDDSLLADPPVYSPMHVVSSLCVVVAFFHILMYVLRLGILSALLSETLVSGFTTGAAIGVFTSQIKDLLGVKLTPVVGKFEIPLNWFEAICKLPQANLTTVTISAITITILLINNEWLKPKLAKICFLPVPIQLIAAVSGTLISKFYHLSGNYNVTVVGTIPTGFPPFQLPDFALSQHLIIDGLVIAIVSYTITVSIGVGFAQKMNYELDFNQELLALGAANVVGSCFFCLPLSASLSRSQVQVLTGGRTQITSIISCSILAFVLLWIGPFFEVLPKCILGSIIVVALKGLLMQMKDFVDFWRISRAHAIVWMSTFLTVVIVSIDIGLLVGIVVSLAVIFIRGLKPYTCLLGHVPKTDLYLNIKRYKAAEEIESLKIFHYCGSLNFASRMSFKTELCTLIELDLAAEVRKHLSKGGKRSKSFDIPNNKLKCLILDFSALSYIDPSGVTSLKQIVNDFQKLGINVYIAGASCPAYEMMKRCGLHEKEDDSFNFYPTIHDAVHHATDEPAPIHVISNGS